VAGAESEQQRFFEDRIVPFHEMVDLKITQNDLAGALSFTERAKSRVLLDTLTADAKMIRAPEQSAAMEFLVSIKVLEPAGL
jgi:hypothetical protein